MTETPNDKLEFAETMDGLSAIDMNSQDLANHVEEYLADPETTGNVDGFLQYLLSKGAIDQSMYRRANEMVSVKLGNVELNDLPKSALIYDVMGQLGQGGMGEIRAARDRHLDRRVALKSLKPDKINDRIVNRFLLESQVTAKLEHPNIIPIYSFHGEEDGRLSLAMKLVSGDDLQDMLDDARQRLVDGRPMAENFTVEARIELFLKICDAMAYAHAKGVLHRDLKPANVMLGEFNEVYVMDWGLAKIIDSESDDLFLEQAEHHDSMDDALQTAVGSVIGTPLFMSPEQARGKVDELDQRADLFSLGAILYELVTLRRMYSARNLRDLLQQVRSGDKLEVESSTTDETIPQDLVAIIKKATALSPDDRYPSVAEFARDIRRFRDNDETVALPDSPVRKLTRWMSKNRSLTLGLVLSLVVIALTSVIWSLYQQNEAIKLAELRTEKLGKLSAVATERAMELDAIGANIVIAAESLAQSTNYLVRNGKPLTGPTFSSQDYASPSTAPPDFRPSERYGMAVSFDHTVYKLAPGVDDDAVQGELARLQPLGNVFRAAMIRSARLTDPPKAGQFMTFVEENGLPIRWGYIGLENGIFISYPGKGGYPPEYDPRERPWYKLGKTLSQYGRCGAPYLDSQGQGTVLPCVAPIRTPEGELLGIAGYEFTFDYLLEKHMQPYGPVTSTYLVNGTDGRVLIDSGTKQEYSRGKLEAGLTSQLFPEPLIRAKIVDGESGQFEIKGSNGVKRIYTVVKLPTRQGVYVEVAPLNEALAWKI